MKQTHTFIFEEEGANSYGSFQVEAEHVVDAMDAFDFNHEGKYLIAHIISEKKPKINFIA